MNNLNDLIKVTNNIELGCKAVSGRNLHEVLGIQQDFTDWIKKQLDNVDAEENKDFVRHPFKREANNATLHEYVLTLDIAKEICMCVGVTPRTNKETKKLSKEVRKYFLECEKQLQVVANQSPQAFVDSLSLTKYSIEKFLPTFLTYKNVDEVIPALIERVSYGVDTGELKVGVLGSVIKTSKQVRDLCESSAQKEIMTDYIDVAQAKYNAVLISTLGGSAKKNSTLEAKLDAKEKQIEVLEQDLTNLRTAKILECGYEDLINAYDTCLIISDMVNEVVDDIVNRKFEEEEFELFKAGIKAYVHRLVKSGRFTGKDKYRDAYMAIYKSMGVTNKYGYDTYEKLIWDTKRVNECLNNAATLCGKYNC